MIHDVHSPEIWRRISRQIHVWAKLIASTRGGRSVISMRNGKVGTVRDSEGLIADLDFPHSIDSTISGVMKSAVQSVIDRHGDGGKTVVLTIAMLFDWLAPLYRSQSNDYELRCRVDQLEKDGLQAMSSPQEAGQQDVIDYVSRELVDIPPKFVTLLSEYLVVAGEYTHFYITSSGRRMSPELREVPGYYFNVSEIPGDLKPLAHIQHGILLLVEGSFGTEEDFQRAFEYPLESELPCVVLCRKVLPLVKPTLIGNMKEGARWMVYEVPDFYAFQDVQAMTGAQIHFQLPAHSCGAGDYGEFVNAELTPDSRLLLTVEDFRSDLLTHIDQVAAQGNTLEIRKRLAMLTGDLWELRLGWEMTDVEASYVSRRIYYVVRAAREFSRGKTPSYTEDIKAAVSSIRDPRLHKCFRRHFDEGEIITAPFPAGVAQDIWKIAFSTVRLLLLSKVLLT